jgi:hypothetical protein
MLSKQRSLRGALHVQRVYSLAVGAFIALVSSSAGFRHQPPLAEGCVRRESDRLNEATQRGARPVQCPLQTRRAVSALMARRVCLENQLG